MLQTALLGYPSMRLLLAAANKLAEEVADEEQKRSGAAGQSGEPLATADIPPMQRFGLCWSMLQSSAVADGAGEDDDDDDEHHHHHLAGCRGRVHSFVESTRLQVPISPPVLPHLGTQLPPSETCGGRRCC